MLNELTTVERSTAVNEISYTQPRFMVLSSIAPLNPNALPPQVGDNSDWASLQSGYITLLGVSESPYVRFVTSRALISHYTWPSWRHFLDFKQTSPHMHTRVGMRAQTPLVFRMPQRSHSSRHEGKLQNCRGHQQNGSSSRRLERKRRLELIAPYTYLIVLFQFDVDVNKFSLLMKCHNYLWHEQ